jgi:hypothetical protein
VSLRAQLALRAGGTSAADSLLADSQADCGFDSRHPLQRSISLPGASVDQCGPIESCPLRAISSPGVTVHVITGTLGCDGLASPESRSPVGVDLIGLSTVPDHQLPPRQNMKAEIVEHFVCSA